MRKSNKPLPQHLNDFLDWLEIEKGLASKSQENYSRFLNKFLNWLSDNNLSKLLPHQLTVDHVWDYRVFLSRQADLKKSTQNYYLIALRQFLNYFAQHDILTLPLEKIKLSRVKDDKTVRFLNVEQLKKLFAAPDLNKINGIRDRAILETFFSTGMRISELTALNVEQIKVDDNTKHFELAIIGKGSRPRTVYFSERALEWIRKYLEVRGDIKEKALFINFKARKGASKRLTARYIEKVMKRYAIKAGLPLNTTPHVMRHSFATDLLGQGVDLRSVQEFLGHKSITATQIYTHVTSKKLRELHKDRHSLQ